MYIPHHSWLPSTFLSTPQIQKALNAFLLFLVPVKPMPSASAATLQVAGATSGLCPPVCYPSWLCRILFNKAFVLGRWRRWCWPRLGHPNLAAILFDTVSSSLVCIYKQASPWIISKFYQSALKKCLEGGETYHHLLISIFQTLPVPRTTNSRLGYTKWLIEIRALAQYRGSQGSREGKIVVAFFSLSCRHMYTNGAK